MIESTLLIKTRSNKLSYVEQALKRMLEGLDANLTVTGVKGEGWVQVAIAGEDENAAANYLTKTIGTCLGSIQKLKPLQELKGYITHINDYEDKLLLDVGIFDVSNTFAAIPLQHLQACLVDGRKTPLKEILELYGFHENQPLNVVVIKKEDSNLIETELAQAQLEMYLSWRGSLLDRLIATDVTEKEIKQAIRKTGLTRDLINVETLGLLEHALTCKLGTDATGLIPIVGKMLKQARFSTFRPRVINAFLETTNKDNRSRESELEKACIKQQHIP